MELISRNRFSFFITLIIITIVLSGCPATVDNKAGETLPTPGGLTITSSTISTTGVTGVGLSWNKVSGATSYLVYRSKGADGNYIKISDAGDVSSYSDSGIGRGVNVWYKVKATSDKGASDLSGSVTTQTLVVGLDAYEPESAFTITNQLNIGTNYRQIHSMYPANDIDYYYFTAVSSRLYKIQTYSYDGDTIGTVLTQKDSTTAFVTNDGTGTASSLAVIRWWQCTTSGNYYIFASASGTGYYQIDVEEYNGILISTNINEGFENSLDNQWTNWIVDSFLPTHSGSKSLKGTNSTGGRTKVEFMVDTGSGKTISYYWKSSIATNDSFNFSIDGNIASTISGTVNTWTQFSSSLTSGKHIISWEYIRNGNDPNNNNIVQLDDVVIQ